MLLDRLYSRDKIERLAFPKQDSSGRPLYFPLGVLGAGYVVATDEQKELIVRHLIRSVDMSFVVVLLSVFAIQTFGWPPVTIIAASIGVIVALGVAAQRRARGLATTDAKLSHGEIIRTQANLTSWWQLIFVTLATMFLFAGELLRFMHDASLARLIYSAGLGSFACLAGLMAYLKWRRR